MSGHTAIPLIIYVSFVCRIIDNVLCAGVGNSENEVWDHLFKNSSYNKYLRPVKNLTIRTDITLEIRLTGIVEFNEVEETITLTAILPMSWRDEHLTWNPTDFENVTHLHIPQDMLWKPYVNLENAVSKLGELGTPSLQADLHHDGLVNWSPIETFKVSCHVDLYRFPFDTQDCFLAFEAYGMHDEDEMFIPGKTEIDLRDYKGTSGWLITETKIEIQERNTGPSHIVCTLSLKRKPLYFVLNIIWPIILLAVLNIFVFLIPVDSGEKVGFVVTMFLSMIVFLTIVSSKLPENSDRISLLNIYVFLSTLFSTFIAVITIIELRVYFRDPSIAVPKYLQKFTKISVTLPKIQIFRSNIVEPEDTAENHGHDNVHTGSHDTLPSCTDFHTAEHLEIPQRKPRVSSSHKHSATRMNIHGDISGTSFIAPKNDMQIIIRNVPSRATFIRPVDEHHHTSLDPRSSLTLDQKPSDVRSEDNDVKWPDVVRAFDYWFFGTFLLIYLISSWLIWRFAKINFILSMFSDEYQ